MTKILSDVYWEGDGDEEFQEGCNSMYDVLGVQDNADSYFKSFSSGVRCYFLGLPGKFEVHSEG